MTQSGHRPDRNPAAQQSPAVPRCAIPFVRKHGRHRAVKRREFITLLGGAQWRGRSRRARSSLARERWSAFGPEHTFVDTRSTAVSGLRVLMAGLTCPSVAFGIIALLPVELILQVGIRSGLCHGVRASHLRDHLESRHLVSGFADFKLPHLDWLDHRCGRSKRADRRRGSD